MPVRVSGKRANVERVFTARVSRVGPMHMTSRQLYWCPPKKTDTAAMLVSQSIPVGVELVFFNSYKFAWLMS